MARRSRVDSPRGETLRELARCSATRGRQIRVRIRRFNGRPFLDLRRFSGGKTTSTGITLYLDELREVAGPVFEALTVLEELER